MPVMGCHSVMLRPDSVRRVTPPTTMTAKTNADEKRSQRPTAGGANTGNLETSASGWTARVDNKRASENRRALNPLMSAQPVQNGG